MSVKQSSHGDRFDVAKTMTACQRCALFRHSAAQLRVLAAVLSLSTRADLATAVGAYSSSGALQLSSYKREVPGGRYTKNYL